MVEPAHDTLPSSPPLRLLPANIARVERYLPILVSLHAIATPIYLGVDLPFPFAFWVICHLLILGSMLLLIQRDREQKFITFRAFYLAFVVWLVILLFGGVNSFFLLWHFAICVIYPTLLPQRIGRALMIIISLSYFLLIPFSSADTGFAVFLVRAAALYFIGWAAYRINTQMIADVVERQELRQQLAQAEVAQKQLEQERELNRHKMQFIDIVSHEFRTPLAIIETAGYLLENHYDQMNDEKRMIRLQEIHMQTTRLTEMMDSIATAEKLFKLTQHTTPAPIDLRAHCEALVEEMRMLDNQQHQIITTYEGALENISIDVERVDVILHHLLSNATKYSPENTDIHLSVRRGDKELMLKVVDKGMGIQGENERLSEPFYRGSNVMFIKGIGLGLALVYESVQQQGGKIEWTSEEGKGTTFEVHLPLV